jgi:hypothetical protein
LWLLRYNKQLADVGGRKEAEYLLSYGVQEPGETQAEDEAATQAGIVDIANIFGAPIVIVVLSIL